MELDVDNWRSGTTLGPFPIEEGLESYFLTIWDHFHMFNLCPIGKVSNSRHACLKVLACSLHTPFDSWVDTFYRHYEHRWTLRWPPLHDHFMNHETWTLIGDSISTWTLITNLSQVLQFKILNLIGLRSWKCAEQTTCTLKYKEAEKGSSVQEKELKFNHTCFPQLCSTKA